MGRRAGRRSGNIRETTEIRIVEAYHDYCPPFDVAKVVRRLLRAVPDKYLRGLDCVVLRNESALTRKESAGKVWSRKRKIDKTRMLGCYHPRWQHKEPWIEIRVDKTIAAWRGPRYFWFPPFREMCVSEVLYHELGHHVHYCLRPEYRDKEEVAEAWEPRFAGHFFWTRYWHVLWPLKLFAKSKALLQQFRTSKSRKS